MKKKILIVTPYFLPEGGGLENYALQLGKQLQSTGNDVVVLCLTRKRAEEVVIQGLRVIREKAQLVLGNTPIRFSLLMEMFWLVKKENIDLLHAHTPVPFAVDVAAFVSWMTRRPLVITYHSNTLYRGKWLMDVITTMYRPLQWLTLRRASVVVAVSQSLKKTYPSLKSKMHVIPSGVDLNEFPLTPYPAEARRCLFIGPLSKDYPSKGLDVLLCSMVLIRQQFPTAELWVAGGGDRVDDFQAMAIKLGIDQCIRFLGWVKHDQIPSLMQQSNLVIVPSLKSEGAPTVIVEAMASGRPVVGTQVGGIPDLIQDGKTGVIVPPYDDGQLAAAIVKYLLNPELGAAHGKIARLWAEDHYAWERVGQSYEQIFESCLSSKV